MDAEQHETASRARCESPAAGAVALGSVFSPRRSFCALTSRPPGRFAPLDGVRGLFTLWVIAAHCLFWWGIPEFRAAVLAAPVLRWPLLAHYAIDAFFVMSAYLLAHGLWRERAQAGSFSLARYFVRRAARILPLYYVAIVLYALAGSRARENLAYNLAFVNNFLPATRQFMLWTWSLAVEEQFYLALPLLLLLLGRVRYFRGALLVGLVVLAAFTRLILVDAHDFGVAPHAASQALAVVDVLYTKTYSRFGSLACGVLLAYLEQERSDLLARLAASPRLGSALGAVALGGIGLVCLPSVPGDIPYFEFGDAWPAWLRPATIALARPAFALSFSLLLALVLSGSPAAAWLGRAASLRVFYPLAQLSYAAYLLHPLVLDALPAPAEFGVRAFALSFVETCVVTYALALVAFFAIEQPSLAWARRFRARDARHLSSCCKFATRASPAGATFSSSAR